jgi:hypothetical protein
MTLTDVKTPLVNRTIGGISRGTQLSRVSERANLVNGGISDIEAVLGGTGTSI